MPLSLTLAELVKKLCPFGKINYIVDPIKLADLIKKVLCDIIILQ